MFSTYRNLKQRIRGSFWQEVTCLEVSAFVRGCGVPMFAGWSPHARGGERLRSGRHCARVRRVLVLGAIPEHDPLNIRFNTDHYQELPGETWKPYPVVIINWVRYLGSPGPPTS